MVLHFQALIQMAAHPCLLFLRIQVQQYRFQQQIWLTEPTLTILPLRLLLTVLRRLLLLPLLSQFNSLIRVHLQLCRIAVKQSVWRQQCLPHLALFSVSLIFLILLLSVKAHQLTADHIPTL